MKLYTRDGGYAGGFAVVASSREEATKLAREQYGEEHGSYDLKVPEPDQWDENDFNTVVFFWGDA